LTVFWAALNLVWASSRFFLAVAKVLEDWVCSVNASWRFFCAASRAIWALTKSVWAISLSAVAFFQTASAASNEDWALVTLKVAVATFCLAWLTTFFLVSTISSALKSSLSAATC
jgi:uncharacterized protein YbjT (DUF2867 family)